MDKDQSVVERLIKQVLHHKFILFTIVATVVGAALMAFYKHLAAPEFMRDLGSAILTAGTIGVALEVYTRHEFVSLAERKLAEVIRTSPLAASVDALHGLVPLSTAITQQGLRTIHPRRPTSIFEALIQECQPGEEIRLLGVCMRDFVTGPMQRVMRTKLRDGCTIRLLTLDPDSEFAEHNTSGDSGDESQVSPRQIRSLDEQHRDFFESLPADLAERMEFGHYDSQPHVLLVATARTVIVSFYLRETRGDVFPHLELKHKPDGICAPFIEHFDSLWKSRVEARTQAQAAD